LGNLPPLMLDLEERFRVHIRQAGNMGDRRNERVP
jgi:hypothetical protein